MKINGLNGPDFDFFSIKNEEAKPTEFDAGIETVGADLVSEASPLQTELSNIAKTTDFNNPTSTRTAIDRVTSAILNDLISPQFKGTLKAEPMVATISEFAQNDPIISQRLLTLLVRLS